MKNALSRRLGKHRRTFQRILDAVNSYKLLPLIVQLLSGLMVTYYTDIRSQLVAQRLDERYISVIEYAAKNGSITNSDVQKILKTSKTTAYRNPLSMKT